jgi:hypothetical protein
MNFKSASAQIATSMSDHVGLIQPGAMAFTRIPRGPTSLAKALVKPRIAAFAVTYGRFPPLPDVPVKLAIFMIDPLIWAFMSFNTSRQQWKVPST